MPVESMADPVLNTDQSHVQVYRAGYEQLPLLLPVKAGESPVNLDEMSLFDAAIVGWTSFTHLSTEELRIKPRRGPLITRCSALPLSDAPERPLNSSTQRPGGWPMGERFCIHCDHSREHGGGEPPRQNCQSCRECRGVLRRRRIAKAR
jgi:hypothetical protein